MTDGGIDVMYSFSIWEVLSLVKLSEYKGAVTIMIDYYVSEMENKMHLINYWLKLYVVQL